MPPRTGRHAREHDDVRAVDDVVPNALVAEHAELELLADNLLVAFASGGGTELLGHWRRFEEMMAHHFAHEEAVLFPPLERVRPETARALREAHLSLREQANAIALRVELGIARHQEIEKLVACLRAHGREEDRFFGRRGASHGRS